MQWSEAIKEHVETLKPIHINTAVINRLMSLIDLTSLNETDTEESIALFLGKAINPFGHVAAVCVGPAFVRLAVAQYGNSPIQIGTVANFPEGAAALETVLIEIGRALQDGAQEVDVVFPYQRYLAGERQYAQTFVESCKAVCGNQVILKVILETGALGDPAIIADASYDAIAAGADFIKTSTGKISEGATFTAAATILLVIKHVYNQFNRQVGFKVAGGIREVQQAAQYVALAEQILGRDWVQPASFRIGSSKLVDELIREGGALNE